MARKLATVETILAINPMDADSLEAATVRGWTVVVGKGEFKPGDLCVYFEIDSILNVDDPRFAFLANRGVKKEKDGTVIGHVLKTTKLRGVVSQGLAMPISKFPELSNLESGTDVTDILGIEKWEPPIPVALRGAVNGLLPPWISKTDEERIQNIPSEFFDPSQPVDHRFVWYATEKIDGMSMTVWQNDQTRGVCSRNYDITESKDNTLWRVAREQGIFSFLEDIRNVYQIERIAVQGELFGEGIQGNPLGIKGQRYLIFNVIFNGQRITMSRMRFMFSQELVVPFRQDFILPTSVEETIQQVDGLTSVINPSRQAEGLVWRHMYQNVVTLPSGKDIRASFKVINNRTLLKAK